MKLQGLYTQEYANTFDNGDLMELIWLTYVPARSHGRKTVLHLAQELYNCETFYM